MYKKTHDVRGRCTDNFMFFRKPLDETIVCKYVFLSYCSGQLIHCLEISGNKNNLLFKNNLRLKSTII